MEGNLAWKLYPALIRSAVPCCTRRFVFLCKIRIFVCSVFMVVYYLWSTHRPVSFSLHIGSWGTGRNRRTDKIRRCFFLQTAVSGATIYSIFFFSSTNNVYLSFMKEPRPAARSLAASLLSGVKWLCYPPLPSRVHALIVSRLTVSIGGDLIPVGCTYMYTGFGYRVEPDECEC